MPTYEKWIERLRKPNMVAHECNCAECRALRTNYKEICQQAIDDLYPEFRNGLPRILMPEYDFMQRDVPLRYHAYQDPAHFYRELLACLKSIDEHNTKIIRAAGRQAQLVYCVDCGKAHKEKEHLIIDGENKPVCDECFDTYYCKCDWCNEIKSAIGSVMYQPKFNPKKWKRDDDRHVKALCRECYVANFMKCSSCGMPLDKDHWVNISKYLGYEDEEHEVVLNTNGQIINHQLLIVEDGLGFDEDTIRVTRPHAVVCKACEKNSIRTCPRCGRDWHKSKLRLAFYNDEEAYLCPQCVDALRVIKRYDYACKPRFAYAQTEPTLASMLHYGVEIEMEYVKKEVPLEIVGEKIINFWPNDFCYIKHDGSLDFGYEAVTHPFTWAHLMEHKDDWISFLLYLRDLGFKAHYYSDRREQYTCGMHVHMSKDAFTRMHLYKFVHFMYKKSTRPLVTAIAERQKSQYADFQIADGKYAVRVGKDKKNYSGKRNSAINLLGGHAHEQGKAPAECKTCEVRIFQGRLEPSAFFKNMEFLQSLYEFSSFNSPRDMQVKKYLEYLLLKPNRWRCLLDFIKYNHYINKSYAYVENLMKGV